MNTPTEPTALIDLRTLAAVSLFTSNEETRYYLKGVLIEVGPTGVTYVATDGHRLAARRLSLGPDALNTLTGKWIVPTEDCRALKPGKRGPAEAQLTASGTNLILTSGGKPRLVQPVDGAFPDWRRIVPRTVTGKMAANVTLNGQYFASVWTFGDALGIGVPHAHWNDDGGPAAFTFKDDTAFCLVMPIGVKDEIRWAVPGWLHREAA